MRKASTALLEQGTQTPSPAPDLIPAETENQLGNSHRDWYSKPGHFSGTNPAMWAETLWAQRIFGERMEEGNDVIPRA